LAKLQCMNEIIPYLNSTADADAFKESQDYLSLECKVLRINATVGNAEGIAAWEKCLASNKKLKYDYTDCKVKDKVTVGSTTDDLFKCYKDNGLTVNKTICNEDFPYAKPSSPSYPITKEELKTLNERYACYKQNLPASEAPSFGREYCENSTSTKADFETCLKDKNIPNLPDTLVANLDIVADVAKTSTNYPFWLIGFDKKLTAELKALGVPPDASECTHAL
jgi:hypothetical protein